MEHEQDILERRSGIPAHPERAATAVSVVVGALLGLGTGFFAATGATGMAIATAIGAVAGLAVAQYTRARSKRERAKQELLDRDIGVIGGDIGAAPPPTRP